MSLLSFLAAAVILAIFPGPGITYVVSRTAAGGRAEGLASCMGTALGGLVHVLAAATGLSLLVAQSAVAFSVVKYVGAAYLVYLGIRMLLHKSDPGTGIPQVHAQGTRKALRDGIVVEALNVKTALFFLAFLPQFVSPMHSIVLQMAFLGVICVVLNTLADVVAVLSTSRLLGSQMARATRAHLMRRASGTVMVGLGAFLALAHNAK